MKNLFRLTLGTAVLAGMMFTSCKKEKVEEVIDNTEVELAALETQTGNDITEDDVIVDENTEEIYIEGEGMSADWLVEEEDMDDVQGPAGGNDPKSIRAFVKKRSFIRCLNGLNLDKDQKKKIRFAIGEYKNCRKTSVTRARAIYNKIKAGYIARYKELLKQFKNGKITRKEYIEGTLKIRKAFINEVRVAQLKEKLHTAIRKCYISFLRDLHGVMTQKQWTAFVKCHRK